MARPIVIRLHPAAREFWLSAVNWACAPLELQRDYWLRAMQLTVRNLVGDEVPLSALWWVFACRDYMAAAPTGPPPPLEW